MQSDFAHEYIDSWIVYLFIVYSRALCLYADFAHDFIHFEYFFKEIFSEILKSWINFFHKRSFCVFSQKWDSVLFNYLSFRIRKFYNFCISLSINFPSFYLYLDRCWVFFQLCTSFHNIIDISRKFNNEINYHSPLSSQRLHYGRFNAREDNTTIYLQ